MHQCTTALYDPRYQAPTLPNPRISYLPCPPSWELPAQPRPRRTSPGDRSGKGGITPSQLALACVLSRGPDIVPTPGTKRGKYLEETVAPTEIELTKEDLERIEAAVPTGLTSSERHPEMSLIGL